MCVHGPAGPSGGGRIMRYAPVHTPTHGTCRLSHPGMEEAGKTASEPLYLHGERRFLILGPLGRIQLFGA